MIKKILKKKTSLAILTLLVIMIFGITINQSLAYFDATSYKTTGIRVLTYSISANFNRLS